ncbi:MAG: tol-pal system-associated acyl-CoA thioesterase [Gammaproteobacteria bacterium]|nr:tol-pal system-associated acyl-CoA thioesterase [Gammaproteobacteria bacterium]MCP5409159.1 tol-pal system-associated acyl-CoA thioesterase [Chromatiaceae bacterium]MCP5443750.1 tol-pal system-associated acyl-CoA thioesterase [Chromatiaceae bacterium]
MTEFFWPVRVYYEDTDCGGVVYYANYLKFMERARSEWLRSLGFEQDRLLQQEGIVFAVRRVAMDFMHPARFNDALLVNSRIIQRRKVSLTFQQKIFREADEKLLVRGDVQVACIDMESFKPVSLPEKILLRIPDVD